MRYGACAILNTSVVWMRFLKIQEFLHWQYNVCFVVFAFLCFMFLHNPPPSLFSHSGFLFVSPGHPTSLTSSYHLHLRWNSSLNSFSVWLSFHPFVFHLSFKIWFYFSFSSYFPSPSLKLCVPITLYFIMFMWDCFIVSVQRCLQNPSVFSSQHPSLKLKDLIDVSC